MRPPPSLSLSILCRVGGILTPVHMYTHSGTDASISTHINNIVERNYVSIGDGRTLIPNPLG